MDLNKINESKTKNKKPPLRYRSVRDYDFLQYIRIAYRWAFKNSDLNRGELEMILYLYPMGVFTRQAFFDYQRLISINQQLVFRDLEKRGWITLWRPRKKGQKALYNLTHKAKLMCDTMHKILVGEKDLPELPKNNKMATPEKRIDNYYLNIMKKMNKENKKIRERRSNEKGNNNL